MNLFSKIKNWFKEFFKGWKPIPLSEVHSYEDEQDINPATGLPMVGGVDTRGNPYGSSGNH